MVHQRKEKRNSNNKPENNNNKTGCLEYKMKNISFTIQDIEVADKLLSDHFVMSFSFNLRKPARATRDVSSRDIRRINLNAFKADVGALQLDSSDLLHSYNSGLREVLDKHAPQTLSHH